MIVVYGYMLIFEVRADTDNHRYQSTFAICHVREFRSGYEYGVSSEQVSYIWDGYQYPQG